MLCHNLMTDDICKVNVTIKTYQVQKALLLMDLSQKTQELVSNVEITVTK